jgi:hypothetical protein
LLLVPLTPKGVLEVIEAIASKEATPFGVMGLWGYNPKTSNPFGSKEEVVPPVLAPLGASKGLRERGNY